MKVNTKKMVLAIITSLIFFSCSSTKKERSLEEVEHDDIKKDYIVKDASSPVRPGWVEDARLWAKEYGRDIKNESYFSYETEPKMARELSCEWAKAQMRSQIAGDVTTQIQKNVAQSVEAGQGTSAEVSELNSLKEYFESTLVEKIEGKLVGASVEKVYWEKRQYLKKLGARKDYTGHTCAVLMKMKADDFKALTEIARQELIQKVQNQALKEKIEKLKN